jgi:hypothetical protein
MSIQLILAATGCALVVWCFIDGKAHWLLRIVAAVFGVMLVFVAMILQSDAHDDYGRHRDW